MLSDPKYVQDQINRLQGELHYLSEDQERAQESIKFFKESLALSRKQTRETMKDLKRLLALQEEALDK